MPSEISWCDNMLIEKGGTEQLWTLVWRHVIQVLVETGVIILLCLSCVNVFYKGWDGETALRDEEL